MTEPRIGDAERELAVGHLREAFADGQLDQLEFEERLKVATRAKVGSDLEPVLADLPNASLPAVAPTTEPASALSGSHWIGSGARPVLGAAIMCTLIYAMTDWGGYFWPMWVWFGVVVMLLTSFFGDDPQDL